MSGAVKSVRESADYILYAAIGALTAAQAVQDWRNPQSYIAILLAALVALKAKRSGNGKNEG